MKIELGSSELNETAWHFIEKAREHNATIDRPMWNNLKNILKSTIEFFNSKAHTRVKHIKRGSTYQVLGEGTVQVSTSDGLALFGLGLVRQRPVIDGISKLVVYRCEETGNLWLRFPDEMTTDRFEELP